MLNGTTRHVYEVVIDDRVQHRYPTRYECVYACYIYYVCRIQKWDERREGEEGKEYIPIGNVSTHKGLRSFKLVLD